MCKRFYDNILVHFLPAQGSGSFIESIHHTSSLSLFLLPSAIPSSYITISSNIRDKVERKHGLSDVSPLSLFHHSFTGSRILSICLLGKPQHNKDQVFRCLSCGNELWAKVNHKVSNIVCFLSAGAKQKSEFPLFLGVMFS